MNNVMGFTVVLREDIKPEQAQNIMDAFGWIEGVIKIEPVSYQNASEMIDRIRVKHELVKQIYATIDKF